MILSLIAAVANNNVIGAENRLIWHVPADLKLFKERTMGHTLIMGRKTFESIGKPLKGRTSVILTTQTSYEAPEGCRVVHSMKQAIQSSRDEKEVFIVGGSEIYQQSIDLYLCRRLYITRIFANFQGDAFFPEINTDKWELVEMEEFEADEKNKYPYAFLTYKKKARCS